jgi:hypothetical protein
LIFSSSAVMAFFTLAPIFWISGQGVMKPTGFRSWYHENAGWADFSDQSNDPIFAFSYRLPLYPFLPPSRKVFRASSSSSSMMWV